MTDGAVDRALTAAGEYVRIVDERHAVERSAWLEAVHRALAELYAAVLALSLDGHEDEWTAAAVWTHEDWRRLFTDLQAVLGPLDRTKEIFDPYGGPDEEPIAGSVADALADIYGQATDGLAIARTSRGGAANQLITMFQVHTGHDAIDAMRAFQAHRFLHEDDEDEDEDEGESE